MAFYSIRGGEILIRCKVKPGARDNALSGVKADELHVRVSAAPEKGRANEAVVRLLADALGVPKSSVGLKTGAGAPRKVISVPAAALDRVKDLEGL